MAEAGSVSNNAEMQQYELRVGEDYALAAYKLEGDTIRFTHTEVPEELEGQGIGSRLVKGALADVRRRGLKVVPLCAFVRHYIETHPETQDLLA
nr:GNAT family N-acetyltransferase [uncultured Sphingosinicella sp.]